MPSTAEVDSTKNSAAVAARNAGAQNDGAQNCKVALVGFGTVGSSVARIVCERANTHLRLTHVLNRNKARKKVDWLPPSETKTEDLDDDLSSDGDLVVEVIGGLQATEDS